MWPPGTTSVLSNSRGPETLEELAAELGPLATAGTAEQAARPATWWWSASRSRPSPTFPAQGAGGKTVIDTGNYYPERDGQIAELNTGALTSSGLLQRDLPDGPW